MIGHFHINCVIKDYEVLVLGWWVVGTRTVYIERIVLDGHKYSIGATQAYLQECPTVYRQVEHKLQLPQRSLKFKPYVGEGNENVII